MNILRYVLTYMTIGHLFVWFGEEGILSVEQEDVHDELVDELKRTHGHEDMFCFA